MSRHEIPRLKPDPRPEPQMMEACEAQGCSGPATPPAPPMPAFSPVRVNGRDIDPEAIAREMQHHPAPEGEAAWRAAAQALVVRELLLAEAARRGLSAEPAEGETEDEALIGPLLDEAIEPEAPSETECRRYYEANIARFRTASLFEASHILIEPEGDGDEAWSRAGIEARRILKTVRDDPALFAATAREVSGCPSAQQDGSLGQVRLADMVPEMAQALAALAPGTTAANPIRTRFGWHVVYLARRIEGEILPFEAAQDRIAEMFGARAWSMAAARFIADLASRAEIEGVTLEPGAAP